MSTPALARSRPPLRRAASGRWMAGVCQGVADHLGLQVAVVRLVTAALVLAGGVGLVGYAFLWVSVPAESRTSLSAPAARAAGERQWWQMILIGLGMVAAAALVMAGGDTAPDWRPEVVIPIVTIGAGAVFVWSQIDASTGLAGGGVGGRSRWAVVGRLLLGLALIAGGLVGLTARSTGWSDVWKVAGAALVVIVGVVILALPWGIRLIGDLRQEQAERIRATARADIAAHLHDSVLQTLALIQRRPGDPQMVARLARAQERQLRSWLYDEADQAETSLVGAIAAAVEEIEDLHGVAVDLVTTGDAPHSEATEPLVRAVREATWNAVRHAAPPISVYVEVGQDEAQAFVRDRGEGFDLSDIPDDRAGVRQSILGRMERHGGSASIRRLERGTEIMLTLPLAPSGPEPKENR